MDNQINEIINEINKKAKKQEEEFVEKITEEIESVFNELRDNIIDPISTSSKKVSEDLNRHIAIVKDIADKSEFEYNDKLDSLKKSHKEMVNNSILLKNLLSEHMKNLNELQIKRLEDDNKNELLLKKIIESLNNSVDLNRQLKEDYTNYINQLDKLMKEEHHDTYENVNELKLLLNQVQTNSDCIKQKLDQLVDNTQKNNKQLQFLFDELNKKQDEAFEHFAKTLKEYEHIFEKKNKSILLGLVAVGIIEAIDLITKFIR